MTAFGRAMMDSVHDGPKRFSMTMVNNGHTISMDCGDFLTCRQDEKHILESIDLPQYARVLDYGCGIGRHLSFVRQRHADVQCIGIESCDLLREYCGDAIPQPSAFYDRWGDIPNGERSFDMILLIGNGLGILGNENNARRELKTLVDALRPQGRIIIETGNPFGTGYFSAAFTIEYQQWRDGPFTWGYSDRDWINLTLSNLDCTVDILNSKAPGGKFFFAVGKSPNKPSQ